MDIKVLKKGDILWIDAKEYAYRCPWKEEKKLAEKMDKNQIKGWERVFVVYDQGEIHGIAALLKHNEQVLDNHQPWLAYFYVEEGRHHKKEEEKLLMEIKDYASFLGFDKLYAVLEEGRDGFERIDQEKRIYRWTL